MILHRIDQLTCVGDALGCRRWRRSRPRSGLGTRPPRGGEVGAAPPPPHLLGALHEQEPSHEAQLPSHEEHCKRKQCNAESEQGTESDKEADDAEGKQLMPQRRRAPAAAAAAAAAPNPSGCRQDCKKACSSRTGKEEHRWASPELCAMNSLKGLTSAAAFRLTRPLFRVCCSA